VLIYLGGFTEAPTASPVAAGGGTPHHGDAVAFVPKLAPNTTAAPTKAPTKSAATTAAFQGKALIMVCALAAFLLL